MNEIRRDPFSKKTVIIAEQRAKRPLEFKNNLEDSGSSSCDFCEGHEAAAQNEVDRIEKDGHWVVRVIPNKYPIFTSDYGKHEVLIESNEHNKTFFNMTQENFEDYISMCMRRVIVLKNDHEVKYISIFKNNLRMAGASIKHSHSQIITLKFVPLNVQEEIDTARDYFMKNASCIYFDEINREAKRIITNGKHFAIAAPYASLYNYEVIIIHEPVGIFEDMTIEEIKELAVLMKDLFYKMKEVLGEFSFNMYFHINPCIDEEKEYYRWHIHIVPRMGYLAGFELSTGVFINTVPPEEAARLLKF